MLSDPKPPEKVILHTFWIKEKWKHPWPLRKEKEKKDLRFLGLSLLQRNYMKTNFEMEKWREDTAHNLTPPFRSKSLPSQGKPQKIPTDLFISFL